MKRSLRPVLVVLGLALSVTTTNLHAFTSEELQNVDPSMQVLVEVEGWSGVLRIESDGDVELADGQQLGEWFSIPDMGSDGGSILIDLGAGATLDLVFTEAPEVGDGGMAILNIGASFLTGWFQFTGMADQNPCEDPRKEKVLCIDTGTEQHSGNHQRHIARVIRVSKCGVFWYEVELVDGSRHSLTIITTGNAGQSGKGTASFDNKVSFVHFKRCP